MTNSAFEPFVRNAWYVAAWSEDLGDDVISRTIMNEDLILFRDSDGKAAALEDRCCHRGAPLSHGRMVDGCVQCGYHGLEFDGAGICTKVPGQDKVSPNLKVNAYPVVERQHFIWIWMGNPALADEGKLLDYPYFDQTDQWPSKKGYFEIAANYAMMIDNLMDLTHLAFVHERTIGGDPDTQVNHELIVEKTEKGVKLTRWMENSPPPPTFRKAYNFQGKIDRWGEFKYVPPVSVIQWTGAIDVGNGARQNRDQPGMHFRLFHSATPKTETSFHYFYATANHYRLDEPEATDELFHENHITFLEDKEIMEVQQKRLETDPTRSLEIIKSDEALVQARKALHNMIEEDQALSQSIAAE